MLILRLSRVSNKFVRLETWSTVLRLFLNPFCSSTKTSLRVKHLSNLSFKIEQYNLYVAGAKVIPLYESGSRGLAVLHLRIGFIAPLPQSDGITPDA